MKRIALQWESYRLEVLPPDAPAVQVQECRRAFYAGAQALRGLFLDTPDGIAGDTYVLALELELDQFPRDVKAGIA